MRDFKKILAWQRAHALSITIDKRTKVFLRRGYRPLRTQITRSASSIAATISEGCGADTNKEFARFLTMAVKSATETENHLIDARDLQLISPNLWSALTGETIEVRKMIIGYRRRVLEDGDNLDDENSPPPPSKRRR